MYICTYYVYISSSFPISSKNSLIKLPLNSNFKSWKKKYSIEYDLHLRNRNKLNENSGKISAVLFSNFPTISCYQSSTEQIQLQM